jgi:osmotically-inducible protein OsmY
MLCVTEPSGRVAEQAERCLRCNSYLALKNVSCEYCEGVLTLRGCLPTYYLKQMAQTAVAQIEGVRQVVNQIQVLAPSFPGAPHFAHTAGFR